jgi:hypothetical protein
VGQIGDTIQIFLRFRGQADHEVQLDAVPASLESCLHHLFEILIRHVLVNHVAQTLGSRFWSKGEPSLACLLNVLGQLHGEGVQPQGGQ